MITFSTGSRIEFPLDTHRDLPSLQNAILNVPYRDGWTATAWGLYLARVMLTPGGAYGARPNSDGVPRIAVLITDGHSNLFPIDGYATALRNSGVQV